MKGSEKQLPIKANCCTFCNFITLILSSNFVNELRVTKIVKRIKFEGVWGELKAKNCFQRQSFRKCLRLTLVFM